jgi:Acyclic terpene utilisation family protein AtuA
MSSLPPRALAAALPLAGRSRLDSIRVAFPSGMLGSGFPEESVAAAIAIGADAIAIDAGSTDSGPHYLGAAVSKSSEAAVRRDLAILVAASRSAGIPLVVGSCGTSGTDRGVDWVARIVEELAREQQRALTMARIYSEQSKERLAALLEARKVHALPPLGELDVATINSCEHIVAVMGHEPILAALEGGADVVLAGRASDTSMIAAVAMLHELPAGPAWHAAKIAECGDQCTTSPQNRGVLVEIDRTGFTVVPLDPSAACTPASVAAHMLYENANPFSLVEPAGVLDTSSAIYTAADSRTVRVEGSRFTTGPATVKLEGAAKAGYETISFSGIADPHILENIDAWSDGLLAALAQRVDTLLALGSHNYEVELRCYGHNGVLGALSSDQRTPKEVGVMLRIRAPDQATATAVAATANPLMLHMPLVGMEHLPSFAFPASPAEIERGATYEFVLNHVVEVADPSELFRTRFSEITV